MNFKKILYILLAIVGVVILLNSGGNSSVNKCDANIANRFRYIKGVKKGNKSYIKKVVQFYIFNLLANTKLSRKEVIKCVKEFKDKL